MLFTRREPCVYRIELHNLVGVLLAQRVICVVARRQGRHWAPPRVVLFRLRTNWNAAAGISICVAELRALAGATLAQTTTVPPRNIRGGTVHITSSVRLLAGVEVLDALTLILEGFASVGRKGHPAAVHAGLE